MSAPPRDNRPRTMRIAGLLCVCLGLSVALCCPFLYRRWKVRRYAGIALPLSARVLSEDDQYTLRFMDGTYSIAYRASPKHVRDLLSRRPEWASVDWSDGRNTNLAKQLDIEPSPYLRSVTGREGVFRILTVDTSTSTVYFELLEM